MTKCLTAHPHDTVRRSGWRGVRPQPVRNGRPRV